MDDRTKQRDTKAVLLQTATSLLKERGADAITLRAVGERAGVSRTAPYRHFKDKEALLAGVAAQAFGLLGRAFADAKQLHHDPVRQLDTMLETYVAFALDEPYQYRLMFGSDLRSHEHPELKDAAMTVLTQLVQTVQEAQEKGRVREGSPTRLAALLYAATHGAVDLILAGHTEPEKALDKPDQLVRDLLKLLES